MAAACLNAFKYSVEGETTNLRGIGSCLEIQNFRSFRGIERDFLREMCDSDHQDEATISEMLDNAEAWTNEILNLVSPAKPGTVLRAVNTIPSTLSKTYKLVKGSVVWSAQRVQQVLPRSLQPIRHTSRASFQMGHFKACMSPSMAAQWGCCQCQEMAQNYFSIVIRLPSPCMPQMGKD